MSAMLDEFFERVLPEAVKLDHLMNYDIPYLDFMPVKNHPDHCEHELVEWRDEDLTVASGMTYHINGLYCIECESYITTSEDL